MANAADRAYMRLRDDILAGRYEFGSRLGEVELARTLGISRTPVRDALRRLGAEGLVEISTNRGARVARWDSVDLEEIYDLRALLESHGTALAARRIGAEELDALAELCVQMDRVARPGPHQDLDELTRFNAEFHRIILGASGSARLQDMLAAVIAVPLTLKTFRRYTPEALERSLNHHCEIHAALAAGDAEWASAVMRSHVHAARTVLLAAAAADPDFTDTDMNGNGGESAESTG